MGARPTNFGGAALVMVIEGRRHQTNLKEQPSVEEEGSGLQSASAAVGFNEDAKEQMPGWLEALREAWSNAAS